MRAVLWAGRLLVFLFLCAFALKNAEPVAVRFLFDSVWQAPLIIVCLAFFCTGVALGIVTGGTGASTGFAFAEELLALALGETPAINQGAST